VYKLILLYRLFLGRQDIMPKAIASVLIAASLLGSPMAMAQSTYTSAYDTMTSGSTSNYNSPYIAKTPVNNGPDYSSSGSTSGSSTYSSGATGQVTQEKIVYRTAHKSPGAKILTGTVGGAAFGGATGALTGLTMRAISPNSIRMSKGTAAVRGLAWGSAFGAGLGFLAGAGSALFNREPAAISSSTTTSAYR
jgi:hypothetical protein